MTRCREHPGFVIRLSKGDDNFWIDACCRRAAKRTLATAEFEVEALMRAFTPN
jgi:hypothetical protein